MPEILFLIIGLLAGGIAAWFMASSRAGKRQAERLSEQEERLRTLQSSASASEVLLEELRTQSARREEELKSLRGELEAERDSKVRAETELKASLENLNEQKALIEAMKKELSDTFGALSSAALKSSNEEFLRLANMQLGKIMKETEGKLGEHKASMDGLVKPLGDALKRYEEQIHQIEVRRKQEYSSLDEQIKMLATTHTDLRKETVNLVTALRKPHVRGRWGEVTLRNVVEQAGMSPHCDFTEQLSLSNEHGRLRPDMVIHLPLGRDIAVDSKVSMEALLDSASATTEEQRRECMKRHASHVKTQISNLSSKSYWSQFQKSPDFVVLFINEASLTAALEVDATLMEDSLSKKVLIATPTTLFALLKAVAYGWRQEQVTKNAEAIAALGKELYERFAVLVRHLNDVGTALSRANEAYNRSAGSMETRVLPSVRKFRELGTTASEEIPDVKKVEQAPRDIRHAD